MKESKLFDEIVENLSLALVTKGIDGEIALAASVEAASKILRHWGGAHLYIPKETIRAMRARNAAIYERFNGANLNELALEYGLSSRQAHTIVQQERKRIKGKVQL